VVISTWSALSWNKKFFTLSADWSSTSSVNDNLVVSTWSASSISTSSKSTSSNSSWDNSFSYATGLLSANCSSRCKIIDNILEWWAISTGSVIHKLLTASTCLALSDITSHTCPWLNIFGGISPSISFEGTLVISHNDNTVVSVMVLECSTGITEFLTLIWAFLQGKVIISLIFAWSNFWETGVISGSDTDTRFSSVSPLISWANLGFWFFWESKALSYLVYLVWQIIDGILVFLWNLIKKIHGVWEISHVTTIFLHPSISNGSTSGSTMMSATICSVSHTNLSGTYVAFFQLSMFWLKLFTDVFKDHVFIRSFILGCLVTSFIDYLLSSHCFS